jgi:putative tricarboxylic transport membrane protein
MIERLLALAVFVTSGVYLANAWTLPLGTAARPGAGSYPRAVGVLGAAVALAWLVGALRRAPAGAGGLTATEEGRGRVGATAGLLVGFCLALPWMGYPLAAFLFTDFLLRCLGAGWTAALALGLVCAAGSYYLFGTLLGVPLPRGALLD